jgi:hypothetical protein
LVAQSKKSTQAVNLLAFDVETARDTALANTLAGAENVVAPAATRAQTAAQSSGALLPEVAPERPWRRTASSGESGKEGRARHDNPPRV